MEPHMTKIKAQAGAAAAAGLASLTTEGSMGRWLATMGQGVEATRGMENHDHWIGLRENLNRKPWFLPSNIGFSGSNFPIIQFYDYGSVDRENDDMIKPHHISIHKSPSIGSMMYENSKQMKTINEESK